MAKGLAGRVAIITGASSGIGRATALALAREGVELALAARRLERLEELADEIEKLGSRAIAIRSDVSQQEQVEALVAQAHQHFGHLDILINNAGFGDVLPVEQASAREAQELMAVNFMGAFYAIRAAVPIMRRQKRGHIINVSSLAGKRALPFIGLYSATKFALNAMSEALRVELRNSGIHVTVVCPIGTETEFFDVIARKRGFDVRPLGMRQPAEKVARAIVKCIYRPKAEVYPFRPARLLVLLNAAFPTLIDRLILRYSERAGRRFQMQGPGSGVHNSE